MKLNKKLFVSSIALLGLTTIAMSTATYAWFTVNKQAAFSATASVKADNNVEIGLAEFGGHPGTAYGTTKIELDKAYGKTTEQYVANIAAAEPTTATHILQDVSGDGATFYKPVFGADNVSFNSVSQIENENFQNYWMEATFKFRSDKPYHIMLGDNTNMIEDTNTGEGGTNLNLAARLAFFDSGKNANTTLTRSMLRTIVYDGNANEYYISSNDDENGKAVSSVTHTGSGDDAVAKAGYTKLSTMNITDTDYCDQSNLSIAFGDGQTQKPSSIAAGHEAGYRSLTVLEKNGTYTSADGTTIDAYVGSVTMVFWIEGADEQCVTANRDGKLSVNVDFAALIA